MVDTPTVVMVYFSKTRYVLSLLGREKSCKIQQGYLICEGEKEKKRVYPITTEHAILISLPWIAILVLCVYIYFLKPLVALDFERLIVFSGFFLLGYITMKGIPFLLGIAIILVALYKLMLVFNAVGGMFAGFILFLIGLVLERGYRTEDWTIIIDGEDSHGRQRKGP